MNILSLKIDFRIDFNIYIFYRKIALIVNSECLKEFI